MTKKVKLSDVARDLQIPTQELIGFYQERDEKGNTKKGVTGLTPEEINLALEYYSQKTQVDSLDAYFASKDKPKSKQEKKSGDKKPADKKPADKKNSDKKPAEKKAADKKLADKKPQPEKKAEEKKPAAPQAQKHEKPKKQQAKAQKHGERLHVEVEMASADSITTEKRRTVDTRGSYVDLDKYNQRYEQIAPASKYTNDRYSTKKQKINQKSAQRNKQRYSSKRETEQDKLRRLELERARKQQLRVRIPDVITVGELATRLKVTATEVIKKLMMLGVMATINEEIDFDTASLVAEELGAKVEHEVIVTIEDRLIDEDDDAEALPSISVHIRYAMRARTSHSWIHRVTKHSQQCVPAVLISQILQFWLWLPMTVSCRRQSNLSTTPRLPESPLLLLSTRWIRKVQIRTASRKN